MVPTAGEECGGITKKGGGRLGHSIYEAIA
jgi:hypothetical protein